MSVHKAVGKKQNNDKKGTNDRPNKQESVHYQLNCALAKVKQALYAGEHCLLSDLGMHRLVGCPNPREGAIKNLLLRLLNLLVLSMTA